MDWTGLVKHGLDPLVKHGLDSKAPISKTWTAWTRLVKRGLDSKAPD